MALNTLFPRQRELVNYDYFDIAEGVGYVVYFGLQGDNGEYMTSTVSNIYSENIGTHIQQNVDTTFIKHFDLDFDIQFNRPKNIKGKIFANIPIGMAAASGTKDFEYYAVVKAVHWDGSTETILATGTSKINVATNLDQAGKRYNSDVMVCLMNITTLKHFKKGETLRFIVEGWFKTTEAGATQTHIMICHDPKNREFRAGTRGGVVDEAGELANEIIAGGTVNFQATQMVFHVPFVLDI